MRQRASVTATLLSAGESLSCDLDDSALSMGTSAQWRSDGRGVIFTNSTIDTQYIFDLDSGACEKTANQFYMDNERLGLEPTGVRWKDQLARFAQSTPSIGQWDVEEDAVLVRGPQDHLYRIAIRNQQLVMTGPLSDLEDSIIVQTASHTAVWAGQNGMDYRSLPVVYGQDRLLRDTPGTVRVTAAQNPAAQAHTCTLPDAWEPQWINETQSIKITRGEPQKSHPGRHIPEELRDRDSWSSLEISTTPNPCSVLDSQLHIPTHRDMVTVGETSVRWKEQEAAFGNGPPTSGQWSGQGNAILVRGPQNHLYTITIDHQILSVSGPFSDFEASGKVRSFDQGRWLSERVVWLNESDTPLAVDIISSKTWNLSEAFDEDLSWSQYQRYPWYPFFRDGEIVHFGGAPLSATTP